MSAFHPYKQGESSKSSRTESPPCPSDSNVPKSIQHAKATKRIRGEIACAECRRLKIRCDKLVPCSTCVKRGCQTLCPNGTIPPGQGGRFVLAATDHLQRKLAKFEARMHSLEDALAIAQATHNNTEPHPLLSHVEEDEYADSQSLNPLTEQENEKQTPSLPDESGTLFVSGNGINRFFGPSGAPESLLMDVFPREERLKPTASPRELDHSYLPPEIINFTRSFPLTPPNFPIASIRRSVESFLPPIERSIALCDTFLENLSWMFNIVSRQLLVSELIPAIYEGNDVCGPHDIALVFIVLAIGVLVDLSIEPYNLEAQHFYHLSRAALVLQPVLTESSIVTVKVLHLMSIYNGLSGQDSNLEQSYALLNLAGQVATKIGFHIDPSSWKFGGREVYDRRVYFWNLLAGSLWTCLVTGRPPFISSEFIDCKIPTAEEEAMYQQGEFPIGFGVWGFQASLNCLLPMVRLTLGTKPPSYERVLDLDAKIRQAAAPPRSDSDPSDERTAITMRTFVRSHYQHLMLLYLHRGFFTQAMTEHPANPLLSPHRKSVIAAYESACAVLNDTHTQFQRKPLLVTRVWRIWSFAFSAAVIVGTVATRGTHLNLEPRALEQFQLACEVFRGAAETNNRAAKALPVLEAMLQKALEAQKSQQNQLLVDMGNEEFHSDHSNTVGPSHRTQSSSPPSHNDPGNQHLYASFSPAKPLPAHPHLLPKISTGFTPKDGFPVAIDPPLHNHYASGSRATHTDTRLSSPPPQIPHNSDRRSFSDLSQSWGGLFHEGSMGMYSSNHANSPGHKRGPPPHPSYGEGTMIHDRWSSFMNYNVLDERPNYSPSPSSRLPAQFQH